MVLYCTAQSRAGRVSFHIAASRKFADGAAAEAPWWLMSVRSYRARVHHWISGPDKKGREASRAVCTARALAVCEWYRVASGARSCRRPAN